MGVFRETKRIQADGQIVAYGCGVEGSAPSSSLYDGSLKRPEHRYVFEW